MKTVRIHPVLYGRSTLPLRMVFEGGSPECSIPIDFILYYLEAEGKRILVDAGCDTMPGFEMRDFIGPVEALKRNGIEPDSITDLIITHAHHDHIEGARHFPKATVHIQKDEYPRGKKYIPESFQVSIFDEDLEICPGVHVIRIGGHSVGSCIVEVETKEGTCVICGDECYSPQNLKEQILTGSSFCPQNSRAFLKTYGVPGYTLLLCHQLTPIQIQPKTK